MKFVDKCVHPNVEETSGKPCMDALGGGVRMDVSMSILFF